MSDDRNSAVGEPNRSSSGLRLVSTFIVSWTIFAAITVLGMSNGATSASVERAALFMFPVAAATTVLRWYADRRPSPAFFKSVGRTPIEALVIRGPNWPLWTVALGITMGLAVGVPVGALLAFDTAPNDLIDSSRLYTVLGFVGMTMLYTIPFAFVIRWTIRRQRQLH